MGIKDDAVEVRAQGWRTLAALHGLIEAELERALQAAAQLSVVEYTVLDALSRQDGWHMRMQQLARATALSPSATTRLVNRLEDRGLLTRILCADDRRGIYTELTASGIKLLDEARPSHDAHWSVRWPKRRRCRNWRPWSMRSRSCTRTCSGCAPHPETQEAPPAAAPLAASWSGGARAGLASAQVMPRQVLWLPAA